MAIERMAVGGPGGLAAMTRQYGRITGGYSLQSYYEVIVSFYIAKVCHTNSQQEMEAQTQTSGRG